ncbi:hypothetical protein BGZ95_001574 [Linnemannia exigua]|uniref:Uncharacterized protein n=1 Tax=Linnemannia exigua TaxID=604196 RepID=A0AAD4DIX9_9FUNG|nr:hypothetical protein BGZ95_001574 [Linnemannia exigua]
MDATWADLIQEPFSKEEKAAVTLTTALPSPSPEREQAAPWSGMGVTQDRPVDSKDEKPATRSTTVLPSPSPELSSTGLPWDEKDDRDLDALLDSHIGGTLLEYDVSPTPTGYRATSFSGFDTLSSFSDSYTTLSVSAIGLGIPQPSTEHGVDVSLSSLRFTTDMSVEQSTLSGFTPFMSNDDFVRALLTPVSETKFDQTESAKENATPESSTTPLCIPPTDLFRTTTHDDMTAVDESESEDESDAEDETDVEEEMNGDYEDETDVEEEMGDDYDDETDVEGTPSMQAYSSVCPPRAEVFKSFAPSAAGSVRKAVRFDMNLRIEELDPDRVMGPPKQPCEERMDVAFRRACREYRDDLDLLQEHFDSKRAAFNSYLHAAFPVVTEESQSVNDTYTNSYSSEDRSTKKHTLDDDNSANEHTAKKSRVAVQTNVGHSTYSITVNGITPDEQAANDIHGKETAAYGEHPNFELMVEDNQPGRVFRVVRWELYHPVSKKAVPKSDPLCRFV